MLFLGIVLTGILEVCTIAVNFCINLNLMIMLYFPNKSGSMVYRNRFEGKTGLAFLKDGFVYVKIMC